MRGQTWTDTMDVELKKLHGEGYSSSQIASFMQMGLSRNAVIGRVFRLGLSRPIVRKIRAAKVARTHKPVARIVRANGNSNGFRVHMSVETDEFQPRCVEVVPRNILLIDLGRDDCRYPYGDGPFVFCGHPQRGESSYCPAHSILTVHTPQRRAMSRDERLAKQREYMQAYRASKRALEYVA